MNNIIVSRVPRFSFPQTHSGPFSQVQDVGAEKDAITSLRAPTHFGRPNWDRVFGSLVEKHPDTDVGVVSRITTCGWRDNGLIVLPSFQFFCGPAVLSKQLHQMSNKYSEPKGTRFFFGKGTYSSPWLLHFRC